MILFASDLHLCPARPGTLHLFERFLEGPARQAAALYLLGDVFDYWAGDDDLAAPFNARICSAIEKVGAGGTAIFFLPGNRDFLAGPAFCAATGARRLADEVVVDVAGSRTLLLHGDTLCTDDADYQRFRAMVRSERWQRDFLALPLTERRAHIEQLRANSEREKQGKAYEIMDVAASSVTAAFRCHEVSRMIHGHTHRPARHALDIDGRPGERWVLPEWTQDQGGYLACDVGGCRAIAFS
ncbi:MAG: UDP-2,3-diacylglucosamine diphosphatase [Gammaproteobacteria bacterium]|nr:UDP-2,3-diacylglucosamine diphosphatase [Gammaproteobacteria bacterium]MBU1646389.1 UDP-2,3-diacylglucosamine diphosphatase [Gammaproteobacteria bacterium]MBU1970932.1 UDP-2,3-diacylglucosamine diphosphatase [Gammaproteobacteria bacterium]